MRTDIPSGGDIRVQYRMALEIILNRHDETPWGFRMTGGKEFGSPFFVVKVGGGTIAERSGLCVGDMVYAINHEYADQYSHADAQRIIVHTGKTLILNIRRGELRPGYSTPLPDFSDAIMRIEAPPTPTPPPMPSPPPPYEVPEDPKKKAALSDMDFLQTLETVEGLIKPKAETPPPEPLSPETPEGELEQDAFFSIKIKRSGRISAIEEIEVPSRSPSRGRSRSPSRERKKSLTKTSRRGSVQTSQETEEKCRSRSDKCETMTESSEVISTAERKGSVQISSSRKSSVSQEQKKDDQAKKTLEDLTDEDITDMLTGEAEVLIEDKGTIGINFNKLIPKVNFIKDSSVLKKEAVKTESCSRKESLQSDSRRQSVQNDSRRQSIQNDSRRQSVQSETEELSIQLEEIIEKEVAIEEESTVVQHSSIQQTEVVEEEVEGLGIVIGEMEITDDMMEEQIVVDQDDDDEKKSVRFEDEVRKQSRSESISSTQKLMLEGYSRKDIKTFKKEEMYAESKKVVSGRRQSKDEFEQQLAEIQEKLSAIQRLPEEIQSHVTSVQEQLTKIVEMKTAAEQEEIEGSEQTESNQPDEEEEELKEAECKDDVNSDTEDTPEGSPVHNEEGANVEDVGNDKPQVLDIRQEEIAEEPEEPEGPEYLVAPPSSRYPHTPQPRPIVLPGGRKWRKPKDAFNDQFIAEAIIGQSEVLVGTTIGVNFCKYIPAKFDGANSAVCRLIHEIEDRDEKKVNKKPERGIEGRAEKVVAEEDYQPPISKRHFFAAKLAERQGNDEP